MNPRRRRSARIPFALMLLGLVLVAFGFWTLTQADDAYRVQFSTTGQECEGNALTLSENDGRPLRCNFYETGRRPFTDSERSQVVTLAEQLGADGLSEPDRARIMALTAQIAAAHGDPGVADDRILTAGHIGFVAGGVLAVLSFYAWLNRLARP